MDEKLLEKYIEMADLITDPFQKAQTKLQARIAYQLTECVAQLKRIADQEDLNDDKIRCHFRDDEWEYYWTIVSLCKALVEKPVPSCDGALRTAVEKFLKNETFTQQIIHEMRKESGDSEIQKRRHIDLVEVSCSGILSLFNALSATPKPRDESALADAVENIIDETDRPIDKNSCNCCVCDDHLSILQSALAKYKESK